AGPRAAARRLPLGQPEPGLGGNVVGPPAADGRPRRGRRWMSRLEDGTLSQVLEHALHGLGCVGLVGPDDAGRSPLDPARGVLARHGLLVPGSSTRPLSLRMTPPLSLKGTPGSGTPR